MIPRIIGARSLAWEMVGYGNSMASGAGRDISVAKQAEYVERWLGHLRIEQALFVGHDLGGGVAQILAVRRPPLVAGVVLTNSIAYDSWPIPSVKAMRSAGGLIHRLPASVLTAMLRGFLALGHDDSDVASDSSRIHLSRYARNGGAEAFVRQVRSLEVRDTLEIADELVELSLPAAILWGEADGFQKIEYGRRLAHDLQAPLESIPGGKHFTPEDHPEEVAGAVNRVLQRAP